jgi:choline kinase
MQALILAAGRGSRLGKITDTTPKCLLLVGRRPIVTHQLEALAEAGVAPVAMVVGYCADEIREIVGIRAEYIENPKWSSTNSLYSFLLARDWIKGPLVILNSDVIFHPEILHRLLATGGDAIAFDSSSGHAPEHMKVRVVDGQLIDMSKDMPADLATGENLGILHFTHESVQLLLDKASAILAAGGEQAWTGAAVRELARERRIAAVDVAGLPWAEIDSAQDLESARREVWPAIQKGRSRVRSLWRDVAAVVFLLLTVAVTVLALRTPKTPEGRIWEPVELSDVPTTHLVGAEGKQTWWVLERDSSTAQTVRGPGQVRVDSRLLLEKEVEDAVPYVLAIEVDGKLVDWFKRSGKPSATWNHPDRIVGKLRTVDIELPAGPHTVQVTFMSTVQGPACAVRVRQLEANDPD